MSMTKDDMIISSLSTINNDIKDMHKDISKIDTTLALNTSILDIHIKRTDLLESELKPLKAHVELWGLAGKLLALLATIATIAAATYEIFWRK